MTFFQGVSPAIPLANGSTAINVKALPSLFFSLSLPFRREATQAVCLGDNPRDYTNQEKLMQVGSTACIAARASVQATPLMQSCL